MITQLFQDDLVASGSLDPDAAEQLKKEQMNAEEKLSRDLAQRKALQVSLLKAKLARKKKDRLKKLRQEDEAEKAKVYIMNWIISIYGGLHMNILPLISSFFFFIFFFFILFTYFTILQTEKVTTKKHNYMERVHAICFSI
jgi:hypothetical protein